MQLALRDGLRGEEVARTVAAGASVSFFEVLTLHNVPVITTLLALL